MSTDVIRDPHERLRDDVRFLGGVLGDTLRLREGSALFHIVERRAHSIQRDFARPLDIWLDGQKVGRARTLSLRVEPDAITCVV